MGASGQCLASVIYGSLLLYPCSPLPALVSDHQSTTR
jgi:hypothetical protein